MVKHIWIPIKALLLAAILLLLVNLVFFGVAYYQADMTGEIIPNYPEGILYLGKNPTGLKWGETKTYGFAGFLFVFMLIREYVKAGVMLD